MSDNEQILPIGTYNLALKPFNPTAAISESFPVSITLRLAALDPEAVDDDAEPSTLRLLKRKFDIDDYEDSDEESEDESADELDDEEEEQPKEQKKSPKKGKKAEEESKEVKKSPKKGKKADEEEKEQEIDEEDDQILSDDELDDEVEEFVLCTLGPKIQYQQTLDLTISPDEEVYFVVTGSYPIHLSGNYIRHPFDDESDEEDYDSEDEDYEGEDSDEYDLTPDEDEILNDEDFNTAKIQELQEDAEEEEPKEEPKKSKKQAKKDNKKRAAEEEEEKEEAKPAKKSKKEEEKKVKFDKKLEKGPTPSETAKPKKITKHTLSAGVVIEDRSIGEGPKVKSGQRVGVRYIGKLKNGKVFDKNVKGKPFSFKLGKGEVIRGWDLGIQGMAVGGERRIVIPPAAAYGSQALPGIPANSELTFDVKLVSFK